jgi:hypothetical protein
MGLLNYTTQVPASKTAAEIQDILRTHGATAVVLEYAAAKTIGLSFEVIVEGKTLSFRLPVQPAPVAKILLGRYKTSAWGSEELRRKQNALEQAERTAWRIVKDWIEAQMALIDVQMVKIDQVFLPYLTLQNGKQLYDVFRGTQFQLPEKGT